MNLKRYFPILEWGPRYSRATLTSDLSAAIIVTTVLVPQALAYAMLAGLPPEMGLYASIAPLLAYAVLGGSASLAVGPMAIVALMTASAASTVAPPGSEAYTATALALALMSGLILAGMGVARLGFIANFLSHPVISGFITAAALIIAASQLAHLLGINASGRTLPEIIAKLAAESRQIHWPTLLLGTGTLAFLLAARLGLRPLLIRLAVPAQAATLISRATPFIAAVITTLLAWGLSLDQHGVAVVGSIPQGLPSLSLPAFEPTLWGKLLSAAVLISVVSFVSSISVARTFATRRRERVDADQELVGLGGANLAAALSSGMPVAGAFARSAVNDDAGARTPAAGAFTALGMLLSVLFLTPWITQLPIATLAAIIMVAVLSLVDLGAIRRTWRYSNSDFAAMTATIAVTLGWGAESGISVGVGLSLALHLYATSRPHSAVLGRIPESEHFRNVHRHDVETDESLVILRVDESLYFANANYLEDTIMALASGNEQLRHIVLSCQAVNLIDASALESLRLINTRLKEAGLVLHLAEVKGPVMERLRNTELYEELTGSFFLSTYDAWQALRSGRDRPE